MVFFEDDFIPPDAGCRRMRSIRFVEMNPGDDEIRLVMKVYGVGRDDAERILEAKAKRRKAASKAGSQQKGQ